MGKLKDMLTLLLAIIWLPVTSHCLLLESASSFEWLSCCAHEDSATTHHEDDCATDACAIVEGAQYKSSLQRVTVPPLELNIAFELPPSLDARLTAPGNAAQQSDDTLMRLPMTWQFSARAALPARAPSFVF